MEVVFIIILDLFTYQRLRLTYSIILLSDMRILEKKKQKKTVVIPAA